MSRLSESQAYQRGVCDCITWLHKEAQRMNDPKARDILNSAAFSIGTNKTKASFQAASPEGLGVSQDDPKPPANNGRAR